MRRTWSTVVLGALVMALVSASGASAQFEGPSGDPSRDDLGRARELFMQGTEHAETGRWADALGAFTEAYRLSGIAAALYNAATTLRSIGRYRDARDAFDQLLEEHPDLGDDMAQSARELRDEVGARVATLTVDDLPQDPGLRLRLDGTLQPDTGARPLDLEADGGRHSLRVELEGFEPFLWEGSVEDGGRVRIPVALVELPDEGPNVARIVILVSLAVLVVAGGVTLGLLLRDDGLQPESMNVVRL